MDARSEALLAAIAASPHDSAARLVFADHIAAAWPAHAALIVAQCTGVHDPALLAAFEAELPAPLRGQLRTQRGFLDHGPWTLEARDFIELDPDVLYRLAPGRTAVVLQDCTQLDAIAARLRRFTSLTLRATHLDAAIARRLAAHPGFAHLQALGFDHTRIDDASLPEILHGFPALVALRLPARGNPGRLTTPALRGLARAPFAATLRTLDLHGHALPALVDVLADLPALRDLDASASPLDAAFAGLPQRFARLAVYHCGLDDVAARALARSPMLAAVEVLEGINPWSATAMAALVARGRTLRELTLGRGMQLGADAHEDATPLVAALADHPHLAHLACSVLRFDTAAMRRLAATALPSLRSLFLLECAVAIGAAQALADAPWIGQLATLALPGVAVDAAAARALGPRLHPECVTTLWGSTPREAHDTLRAHVRHLVATPV